MADSKTSQMADLVRSLGMGETEVDELVYDVADSLRGDAYNGGEGRDEMGLSAGDDWDTYARVFDSMASDINNSGLERQLEFLQEHLGDTLEKEIRKLAE